MTYRSDSDIYAPYDRLLPKSAPPLPGHEYHAYNWSEVRDAISKKDKLAFQLVSNCYSRSGREAIVNELQKHIEVSVRGQCSNFVCDTACEKEMLERHKFYLAFENSICDEYVSEKVWRMKQLIVPVVLRASDYSTLLPNGSFLAVDQFPSLYQLALQLLDLASNNSEYER
ncbi:unnamed protein product [Toxocara canis]|uniref:Fucosyltransferase n=1 Tax=Toxocara canis TaxID=6265 RepID=A0A183UV37_TOXCA|nr:unnamed protein product [Toxocara canis]